MRTVTAGEQTLLEGAEYSVHVLVRCEDPDGVMVRMDTLEGHNWIREVRYGESVDQPVMGGDIIFARTQEDPSDVLSLEPLDTSSIINRDSLAAYARFLDSGRDVDVYVATLALGTAKPAFPGSDWQHVVSGVTDRWFNPTDGIGIRFRDRIGAELQDRWIETPKNYGANDGSLLLEDVIQDILDDWTTGYTLEVPTASAFAIREYEQQEMRVFDAIRVLARLRGWDVRVLWNDSGSDFRVTLYAPNRSPGGTDWNFTENRVINVAQLQEDREGVRNAIVVTYPGSGSPLTRTDTTSITKYGRRFMGVIEGSDSPIDTLAEAQTFADAILDDLKDPVADQEIEKMYWWPGEVGDYYQFQPLRPYYDTAQSFGVTSIRHELGINTHRTFIHTRGKPSAANREWRRHSEVTEDNTKPQLLNFRDEHLDDGTGVKFTWSINSLVANVEVFERTVALPETGNNWPDALSTPTQTITSTSAQEYTTTWPDVDTVKLLQFVPRSSAGIAGPFRRARITPTDSVITPAIQVQADQTGSTATVTLTISDPDERVTAVAFKSKSGPGDLDATDPDDGTWSRTTPPSLVLTHNETIGPKHGAAIAWAVQYQDASSASVYISDRVTFDADEIAEITSVEISFSTTGTIVASPTGDEDTEEMYIEAGTTSPIDPGDLSSSILGRSGTLDTGVSVSPGGTAFVKVRGRNSVDGFGPVQESSAIRGIGVVPDKHMVIGATDFQPADAATTQFGYSPWLTIDGDATTRAFYAAAPIPAGAIVTSFSVLWTMTNASDAMTINLVRLLESGSTSTLGSIAATTGTLQTPSDAVADVEILDTDFVYAFLSMSRQGALDTTRFYRLIVTYDAPDGVSL